VKITVLGCGAWGLTVGKVMAENGHEVVMWSHREEAVSELRTTRAYSRLPGVTFPDSMDATTSLEACLSGTSAIVLAVSSPYVSVLAKCKGFLKTPVPILILTKGLLDSEGHFFVTDYIAKVMGEPFKYAILSGPNLAPEVARGLPAATVIASYDSETSVFFQKLCSNSYFRAYTSCDVRGVEVGGIIKNVIAVAAGMMESLGLGKNATSALIARGLHDIARFGELFGAKRETFLGLSGVGDLVATCTSDKSRNFQVGFQLAKLGDLASVIAYLKFASPEGIRTAKIIHEYAKAHQLDLPIVSAVYAVVYEGVAVKDAIHRLMSRELRTEF